MGILRDIFNKFSGKSRNLEECKKSKVYREVYGEPPEINEFDQQAAAIRKASADTGVKAKEAVTAVQKAIRAMAETIDSVAKAERENTNNWRKMHGLPMRRRNSDARRRKR